MNEIVNVFANKIKVGTLALTKDNRIAFNLILINFFSPTYIYF